MTRLTADDLQRMMDWQQMSTREFIAKHKRRGWSTARLLNEQLQAASSTEPQRNTNGKKKSSGH